MKTTYFLRLRQEYSSISDAHEALKKPLRREDLVVTYVNWPTVTYRKWVPKWFINWIVRKEE